MVEGERIKGKCEVFNPQRGYGFIFTEGGEKLFLHARNVIGKFPQKNDELEFRIIESTKPAPAGKEKLREAVAVSGGTHPSYEKSLEEQGLVEFYNRDRGFGYVVQEGDGYTGRIFFHATSLVGGLRHENEEIVPGLQVHFIRQNGRAYFVRAEKTAGKECEGQEGRITKLEEEIQEIKKKQGVAEQEMANVMKENAEQNERNMLKLEERMIIHMRMLFMEFSGGLRGEMEHKEVDGDDVSTGSKSSVSSMEIEGNGALEKRKNEEEKTKSPVAKYRKVDLEDMKRQHKGSPNKP